MFAMEDLKLFNEAGIPKVKCAAARLKTGNSHGARPILNLHQKSKYKWCICLKIIFKKNTKIKLAPMCETSAPSSKFRSE